MITLISPSKTQDFNCRKLDTYTLPVCLEQTQELVATLQKLSVAELEDLMGISPKLAELNFSRFKEFSLTFDLSTAKQALLAFKGDVYSGIDTGNYSDKEFAFAQEHLRIISGLYGLLKPLDLIQAYRLEMGTKLAVKNLANLYQFWGSRLTEVLNDDVEKAGSTVVLNLASNEYSKAIKPKELRAKIISVTFKEKKGESYKVVAIHAKRARGLMADFIIRNRLVELSDLISFKENGYRFRSDFSCENELVFCRD